MSENKKLFYDDYGTMKSYRYTTADIDDLHSTIERLMEQVKNWKDEAKHNLRTTGWDGYSHREGDPE